MNPRDGISLTLGIIYTVAWSISFYPQVILNHTRKSVRGYSANYVVYNVTGFLFYSIFSAIGYHVESQEGIKRTIQITDLLFVLHGFVMVCITAWQFYRYKEPGHPWSKTHAILCLLLWVIAIYNVILSAAGVLPWVGEPDELGDFKLSTVVFLGIAKALTSLFKYIPQAWMNMQRQSTVGWAVGNVLLDLTGGLFSFAQQIFLASTGDGIQAVTGNIPKFALSIITIGFDLLFIFQHYVLYRDALPTSPASALKDSDYLEQPMLGATASWPSANEYVSSHSPRIGPANVNDTIGAALPSRRDYAGQGYFGVRGGDSYRGEDDILARTGGLYGVDDEQELGFPGVL